MENSSLDEDMLQHGSKSVNYASFFQRVGASIIDVLCLLPLIGATFYNNMDMKNMPLMLLLSLLMISYKPFMEWKYGKTFGKMATNIQVTDLNFENASLQQVLLRNVFGLAAGLLSLITTYTIFTHPDFENVAGFMEFSQFQTENDPIGMLAMAPSVILILGCFAMFANDRKQCLHDMIGSTVVLDRTKRF